MRGKESGRNTMLCQIYFFLLIHVFLQGTLVKKTFFLPTTVWPLPVLHIYIPPGHEQGNISGSNYCVRQGLNFVCGSQKEEEKLCFPISSAKVSTFEKVARALFIENMTILNIAAVNAGLVDKICNSIFLFLWSSCFIFRNKKTDIHLLSS